MSAKAWNLLFGTHSRGKQRCPYCRKRPADLTRKIYLHGMEKATKARQSFPHRTSCRPRWGNGDDEFGGESSNDEDEPLEEQEKEEEEEEDSQATPPLAEPVVAPVAANAASNPTTKRKAEKKEKDEKQARTDDILTPANSKADNRRTRASRCLRCCCWSGFSSPLS